MPVNDKSSILHCLWLRVGVFIVAGLLTGLLASPAYADFSSSHYSKRNSSCTVKTDPVTVVFFGFGAYAGSFGHSRRTFDLLNAMADPDHDWTEADASRQFLTSHGVCTDTEKQVGTGCDACNRYHIRLNQTHHPDTKGRYETVGTAHEDKVSTGCGFIPKHIVPPDNPDTPNADSGFDLARGHVKNDWLAAYGGRVGDVAWWGNNIEIRQCNGDRSGSSGRVYWLKTD